MRDYTSGERLTMITVQFKFAPKDIVSNPVGAEGYISFCGYDVQGDKIYYVATKDNSQYWNESELKLVKKGP